MNFTKSNQVIVFLVFLTCFYYKTSGQTAVQNFGSLSQTLNIASATSTTLYPNPVGSGTTYARIGTGGGALNQQPALTSPVFGTGGIASGSAPTGTSVNKITPILGYTASTQFYTKFDILLGGNLGSNTAATGTWSFFQGSGATYSNANGFNNAQVFTGFRFIFGASGAITTNYRNGAAWALISTGIAQSTKYTIEIMGNNTVSTISYTYNGGAESVAMDTYDLWVNGVRVGDDLAKAGLANSANINAMMFYGESSVSNEANIFLDNMSVENVIPPTIGIACIPTKLAFSATIPTLNQDANIANIEVQTQTAASALCAACGTGTVTLTFSGCGLYGGTGGTTVTTDSTATASVVGGKAIFSGLKIKRSIQTGVVFKASYTGTCGGGTLTAATSNTFAVSIPAGSVLIPTILKDDNFSTGAAIPWAYILGTPTTFGSGGTSGIDITSVVNVAGNDMLRKTYSANNTSGQKGTIRTITFDPVTSIGAYNTLLLTMKIAASVGFSGGGAGMDIGENLYVETQINGSGTWEKTFTINTANNAKYDFTPVNSVTIAYNANAVFSATGISTTTENDFAITFPSGVTSVQFRIVAANNRTEESWDIDDVRLTKIVLASGATPMPLPTVSVSDITICTGGNGVLMTNETNVASPASYSWTPSTNLSSASVQNPTASPALTQSYTVYITDDDGCKASTSATVMVGKPNYPPVSAPPICGGSGTSIIMASGATTGHDYKWYSDTTFAPVQINGSTYTTPTLSTSTDYFVSIYNTISGCESFRTKITVSVAAIVTSPSTTNVAICSPGGAVTLNASGALAGENYKWYDVSSGGNLLLVNASFFSANVTSNTTFYVTKYNTTSDCESTPRTPVTITVTPIPVTPTISYPGLPFCTTSTAILPTQTGATGGVYSSTAGLIINATTGEITPSTSTGGSYTVTYTVAAANGCAAVSATANVAITTAPVSPTISYTGSPFCTTSAAILPTQTGATGGVYSSTAGLTINATTGEITPSTSTGGSYTVTYTVAAANGCAAVSNTTNVAITTAPVSPTISYAGSPFCTTSAAILPTQTGATGGVYSSTVGLSLNASTGQITPSTSTGGSYTITYTVAAANGCAAVSATANVAITTAPVSPTISYAGSPFCTTSVNVTPTQTGATGGVYSSTAGLAINATTGEITPSTSTGGSYTITYTVAAANGCAAVSTTANVAITTAPVSPTISYTGSPFCTTSAAILPTQTGVTGGVYSSTAGLTINATTGEITPSTSTGGSYTVTYTVAAANGCAAVSATANVAITTAPVSPTISYPSSPFCTTSAAILPTQTGATGGIYSSTAGLIINATTGEITPSTSTGGSYTITYTVAAANGCAAVSNTTNVAITTAPVSPTISYTGSPFCTTSAAILPTQTGATGGVYSSTTGLSLDANTGEITPSTSTGGSYTVTYTVAAANGCAAVSTTANVAITTAPVSPTISYTGSPFCTTSANVTPTQTGATGGVYSSTAGLTINATTGEITPSTSTGGAYTITYTVAAANGCAAVSATANVAITTAPVSPTISYTGSPFCTTSAAILPTQTGETGGVYSSTVGLSLNATTGEITPSTSTGGSYTVTYTVAAANGCAAVSNTTNVVITTAPVSPTISYTGSLFCTTSAAILPTQTGATGGVYSSTAGLSLNATTGEITPSTSTGGSYTVTYTVAAANGCAAVSNTTNVAITTAPVLPTISYTGSPFCTTSAAILPTQTGATGGVYSSTAGLSLDANTGEIAPSTSTGGSYTITYTVAAANGCAAVSNTTNVAITTAPVSPTISYAGSPFCTTAANITPTQTGATGGVYSSTAGLSIDATTGQITPSTSTGGSYTITYTVAAANGCAAVSTTANVVITTAPVSPTISYIGSPFCTTSPAILPTQTGATGGVYSSTAGLSIDATTGQITPSTSTGGSYTITYTVAAANGCAAVSNTTNVTITTAPVLPTISYTGSPFCTTSAAILSTQTGATGGVYSSTVGLSLDANTGEITPSTSTGGSYTVTYTVAAANGCAAVSNTANVAINMAAPQPTGITQTAYCGSVMLSALSNATGTYSWYDNAVMSAGNLLGTGNNYTTNATGTYYLFDVAACASPSLSSSVSAILPLPTTIPSTNGTNYIAVGECLDAGGVWTHYYDSNNNLLLSIQKNGQSIGTIGDGTFSVNLSGNTGAPAASGAVNIPANSPTNYVQSPNWYVMNRYWNVVPNGLGAGGQITADVNVRFYYKDADVAAVTANVPSIANNAQNLHFYKINGNYIPDPNPATNHALIPMASAYNADGYWQYNNGAIASTTDWLYGSPSIGNHYAEFTIGKFSGGGGGGSTTNGALPITLTSFTGYHRSQVNILDWETNMEINADKFEVLRKNENSNFEKIGEVKAKGYPANYTFTDNFPYQGINQYQLKLVDIDGRSQYSEIVELMVGEGFQVSVFPNPSKEQLNIKVLGANETLKFTLCDALGKEVSTHILTSNKINIVDISSLGMGVYFYKISGDRFTEQGKILKIE